MSDHDRPLNQRGKEAAPRMGQLLREQQLRPATLLSSTAKRARKTAKLVARSCGGDPRVLLLPELYLAAPSAYLEALQSQPDDDDCLMVVGHNPGLEQLVELITGECRALPTAAVAAVELDLENWSQLDAGTRGRLTRFWLPRELE